MQVPRGDPRALAAVTENYEIVFAADPCTDRTLEIVRQENAADARTKLLVFSRLSGNRCNLAGLAYSRGQAIVVIDCDLQDPPGLIPEMVRLCARDTRSSFPSGAVARGRTC